MRVGGIKSLGWFLAFLLGVIMPIPVSSFAGQWVNPRDAIGDPMIARLQQGRKELTPEEKEEIKRYGYTGLEIMTYMSDNLFPGEADYDVVERQVLLSAAGHIKTEEWLLRVKYNYKNQRVLLTYEGIKPGDIDKKDTLVYLNPANLRGDTFLDHYYLTSKEFSKENDSWGWTRKLRRVRRFPSFVKEDGLSGGDITWDDVWFREPWEDTHRILGEDTLGGRECLVVESKNQVNPNYYLLKRVTWVEKESFLDLHEEQFDREGRLFKAIDNDWQQIKPWNYWAKGQRNFLNLSTKTRTIYQSYEWIFDQGLNDSMFTEKELRKGEIWRQPKNPPPPIKKPSDFPPAPQVRQEFWHKIGVEPRVAN